MKTYEEGYALGWADAIYAYESKQRKKMSTQDANQASDEIERLRATIDGARELLRVVTAERDALRSDALRYRWLRGYDALMLRSDNTGWTRPDGTRYLQTHYLAEGKTQHRRVVGLDATIDAAMAQKDAT